MRKYAAPRRDMLIRAMEAIGGPATSKELQDRICRMFGAELASLVSNALQTAGPSLRDAWRYFDKDQPSGWPPRYRLSPLGLARSAEIRKEREAAAPHTCETETGPELCSTTDCEPCAIDRDESEAAAGVQDAGDAEGST